MPKLKLEELTDKQKVWADAYLGPARFIASEAAVMAGYSKRSANELGSRNLKNPLVRRYLNEKLAENCMSPNEVLSRLADIAKASIEDVLDEDGNFDFKAAKRAGKLSLVKKLKRKTTSRVVEVEANETGDGKETLESSIVHEDVEFEMYSAHEALRDIGKYHKLFVDRHEVEASVGHYVMTKEEWEEDANRRLEEVNKRLKG